jgi:hypothetical protein
VDDLSFKFKAFADGNEIVVRVIVDGAQAEFRYTDADSVGLLAANMKYILDYAVEDYMLNKKFKEQLNDELEDWLNDGP